MSLTRRQFIGVAGCAGVGVVLLNAGCSDDEHPDTLPGASSAPGEGVINAFPFVLAFRQSEVLVSRLEYDAWARQFDGVDGFVGKAVREERSDSVVEQSIEYFTRFKQENPDKIVLLHFNGRGRLPGYSTDGWFAGDWLYYAGSTVTRAMSETDTIITVDDPTPFTLETNEYQDRSADLVVCDRSPDGTPDWSRSEQVTLTRVRDNALTIRRGQHGTTPLAFASGGYVAPHVHLPQWGPDDQRLWVYNLSTVAPRGGDGRSAADRILAEFHENFGSGGKLAALDGIQLDIFLMPGGDLVDADGDGIADGAINDGMDTYLAGQAAYTAGLREALGSDRFLLTDGGGSQQPDVSLIDGIETEGFPKIDDDALDYWEQGLTTLAFWKRAGGDHGLCYALAKTARPNGESPSPARTRVTLAATLLTGTAFSFWDQPAGGDLNTDLVPGRRGQEVRRVTLWDEIHGGHGHTGWLGRPTKEMKRLVTDSVNLAGTIGPFHIPADNPFRILDRPDLPDGDLFLGFDLRVTPSDQRPGHVPALIDVTITTDLGESHFRYVADSDRSYITANMNNQVKGNVRVRINSRGAAADIENVALHVGPNIAFREFENGAVFVNPSGQDVEINVGSLSPNMSYRRILASDDQDQDVNNGKPLGHLLTLPARDALIVRTAE